MRPGYHSTASPANAGTKHCWVQTIRDTGKIYKPGFQSRKRTFTVFCKHQEPVAVAVFPADSATTGSHYAEAVLPKVVQEISSQRPITTIQNVLLLHNNASLHKTKGRNSVS